MNNQSSWPRTQIGNVCHLIKGLTYKSEDYSTQEEGEVFLTLKCIAKGGGFNNHGIKYFKNNKKNDLWLSSGDLIIANTDLTRDGDVIGAPLFVPKLNERDKYVYSMDISKIEVNTDNVDLNYLYQYLLTKTARNYMRGISNGSTVLHLKVDLVGKLSIPLPTLETQQKIGRILNSVDELINKTDQIIQTSEKLKYGLMNELLTKGIGHSRYKNTKLGKIPEEWNIVSLNDVAKITNGQVDPKNEPYLNMVLIAPNHVESSTGRIIEKISAKDQQAISGKYLVDKGDVIYSKIRPYLKKVAISDSDCLCSADMYPMKGVNGLSNRFLFYILLSDQFTNYANNCSGRTGIPKINREELAGFSFALPPIKEQEQITSTLSSIEANILHNHKLKEHYISLKSGLTQDIFDGKAQLN